MYTQSQKKRRLELVKKNANPVFIGGSDWMVPAPKGWTRREVEQEMKIAQVARDIYLDAVTYLGRLKQY